MHLDLYGWTELDGSLAATGYWIMHLIDAMLEEKSTKGQSEI